MSDNVTFLEHVTEDATFLLQQWVGEARAREATGRIATAFSAASMAAKNPSDFFACDRDSVARCIATAALTGIMPSTGQAALAYLIPRRPRKGEPPQLNYMLSHRGLMALARRAGCYVYPIPVGRQDRLDVVDGEVVAFTPDIDNPPTEWEELRGVVVVVKGPDGTVQFRGWVPAKLIDQRRRQSDSYRFAEQNDWAKRTSTWHVWAVEMAMKVAIHYAIARGWAIVDDTEAVRALSLDHEQRDGMIDLGSAAVHERSSDISAALGVGTPSALPDHGPQIDEFAGFHQQAQREVEATATAAPTVATVEPDRSAIKGDIERLQRQLVELGGPAAMSAVRATLELPDRPMASWKVGVPKLQAYADALTEAIAAKHTQTEPVSDEPGDDDIIF